MGTGENGLDGEEKKIKPSQKWKLGFVFKFGFY